MATISVHYQRAELTIPAAYMEDMRTAAAAAIDAGSRALGDSQAAIVSADSDVRRVDRACAMHLLSGDVGLLNELLNDLLDACGDTSVSGERQTLHSALEAMMRVVGARLAIELDYVPIETEPVLELTERLRWAAQEASRLYADSAVA